MQAILIVIIAVAIYYFAVSRPKQKAKQGKMEYEIYDKSEYVQKALRFIEFSELGPADRRVFVTPDYIGVYLMGDDSLGFPIMSYLNPDDAKYPVYKEAQRQHVYEEIEKRFGGSKGMELYRELDLNVKLHDGSEDFPIIFMWHRVPGNRDKELIELEKYARAIERQYRKQYGKELSLSQFLPGW